MSQLMAQENLTPEEKQLKKEQMKAQEEIDKQVLNQCDCGSYTNDVTCIIKSLNIPGYSNSVFSVLYPPHNKINSINYTVLSFFIPRT